MTAGKFRYAEMIAIRLAVEILAGHSRASPAGTPPCAPPLTSARSTPPTGTTASSLVALLQLQSGAFYRPNGTVTRALAARP